MAYQQRLLRGKRLSLLIITALVGFWLAYSLDTDTGLVPQASGQPPAAQPPAAQPPAKSPLEQPLQWLYEGRKFHASLRDYTCYMLSQERVKGELKKQNVMQFMFRPQPFSVYMKWLSPADLAGQEVAYVQGKNGDKMRVNPKAGTLGGNSWHTIDPNDRRVFEHSRHTIREAGIGAMSDQLIRSFEMEKQHNKTQATVSEYNYSNRRCYRIEITRTERRPDFYCYRTVVYIDQENKLPIRMENYDWPVQGGAPGGELLELFSYYDIQFNRGLTDANFNK